jgi:uroporphyrinogen-III synthase
MKVAVWLRDSSVAAQLAAAGYHPQHMHQQLQALLSAQAAAQSQSDAASRAAFAQLLHDVGVLFSSVAVPHFCNNPGCQNLAGLSDTQLVSGRSCLCAGCVTARYCSRGCQKQHWKQHKPVCKALAAAAAAAAAIGSKQD